MKETIERYFLDKDFYSNQSKKALERAEFITNSDKLFGETVQEYIKRERKS